ncbi:hypothetical protein YC2023_061594 [Brassica napus]
MTRISDLSQDLIEEILSRVPLTCQRAVLSTCKQWNSLYKDEIFTKKHRGKAANDTVVCDSRVCLVSVDLEEVQNDKLQQLFYERIAKCDSKLGVKPKTIPQLGSKAKRRRFHYFRTNRRPRHRGHQRSHRRFL